MAGPALLAHILVAKYDDQLPLYRQGEIFARMGADIPALDADRLVRAGRRSVLRPLADLIRDVVVSSTASTPTTPRSRCSIPGRSGIEGLGARREGGPRLGLRPRRATLGGP
jgi:hypothetical protein